MEELVKVMLASKGVIDLLTNMPEDYHFYKEFMKYKFFSFKEDVL